ncbi:excinuclease ABC subunit UvrC [Phocea massiliensis]|uniref:UvrABC system protein C n=1 Tax=Merdimmobilis hominis TaxID=2897707 RepID=A0A939BEH6_9FIRM|nr:excinuclease ABC subunit UvrC [Merdimmobilis hominis]MBM6920982.1 excinuclease ABC subunit UvrC [Merdimmobilis hominis]
MNQLLEKLRKKALNLTHDPGVYLMKNSRGEIIYIGKAKNLKNRVSQYFQPNNPSHTEKVRRMVEQVADFDYIVVGSEFEALVLECSLIKQNNPKYNILLKDDKGYHYIRVERGSFPKISAQKQMTDDDADYLGPYTSSFSVTQTVDEVNKIFGLPTCNRKFPEDFKKARPCLNYHIKQCMGVCRGRISEEEYAQTFKEALAYIKKGGGSLLERLTRQMEEAAEALDFERAAKLRDRIQAIRRIADTQKVYLINTENQDVIAFAQNQTHAAVAVLKFRNYRLSDKEDYFFPDVYDIETVRQSFLSQYYMMTADIPPRIVVDEPFEDAELLAEHLKTANGRKVTFVFPQKGDQKKMVDMAFANASERLSKYVSRTGREVAALDALAKLLGLKKPPVYIEAYDISNLGESSKVGGMVVFENGRPLKKAYKKFRIRQIEGQDDYASMQEVITRRLSHYEQEKDTGEGFGRLPDLILLDGGKGHVAAILPIIQASGLDIPVFGMVKDNKHRTRAIAKDGGEISISANRVAFSFVTTIQDEVHRYAIRYQKQVHTKSSLEITLTRVKGIGDKKASQLLSRFRTRAELLEATPEQLAQAAKLKPETAQELFLFLHALS